MKTFPKLPWVAPLVAKTGPWTGANELGQEQAFAPDSQNRQRIIKLPEWGPPEVWTATLGFRAKPELDTSEINARFEIQANVEFGSGGSTQSFQLDWIRGASFSVPMNSLAIDAVFERATSGLSDLGIFLSVQLARGGRGSSINPTFSEQVSVAGGGFGSYVTIPPFARRVQLLQFSGTGSLYDATSIFRFVTCFGGVDVGRVLGSQLINFPMGIPIPKQAKGCKFDNAGGNTVAIAMVFELCL